jgi:hypothetical protein
MEDFSFTGLNQSVPDGNAVGMADVQSVVSTITQITALTVDLDIGGEFNGDLYAYVTHDTGFAVLLNRPGRTAAEPFGYDDTAGMGVNVTFDDAAANGDIHSYLNTTTPAPGTPLTGMWAPDGRTTDPDFVLDTDGSTAFLSSFTDLDANGNWTLFVADLSGGGNQTLNGWSLSITGVPEPTTFLLFAAGLLGFFHRRLYF